MWTVLVTPEWQTWLNALAEDDRLKIMASVQLLQEEGPSLRRPHADTLKGARLKNLRELRTQSSGKPFRSLYAFDPLRQAVILIGGDKTGDKRFYERMIPVAEKLFGEHLAQLEGN